MEKAVGLPQQIILMDHLEVNEKNRINGLEQN